MSAPAGETHRAGVRQTRHEIGPAPPITSSATAIHPRGQPLLVESMFAIGLRPTTTTLANATAEKPGPFCVRAALLKTTNFSRGFCGWFRAGALRAARQAVGPAVFPASAFHCRSAINPCGPTGGQQPLHQCQTNGDAYEATGAGRARTAGGRAWAGSAPGPVSELRIRGFYPTAQVPRTPEQRDT